MSNRTATEWLLHQSGRGFRRSVGNPYIATASKLYRRYRHWNGRDAKVYDAVREDHQTYLRRFNEADARPAMFRAAGAVAGLGVVRAVTGLGTAAVRGGLGLLGFVAFVVTQAPPVVVGITVQCVPLLAAAAVTATARLGVDTAKAVGRFGQRVVQRYRELGKKSAATPAVETPAPAQLAAEAPAVAAPAVPSAPSPRLTVPGRAVSARQVTGRGLE